MARFDTVVKGGTLVDGTGAPRLVADLGIRNGVIAEIGQDLAADADEVIDAGGLIVAPGVIDTHTHYDAQIHWDPYVTNSGWHGSTTIAIGNCGFGLAPCHEKDRERYMRQLETTEQVPFNSLAAGMSWQWTTFPEWMEHLSKTPKGVNVLNLLPLNPLLIYVMGLEEAKSRAPTDDELKRMKQIMHEAMDAGAIGFGFSYQGDANTHIDIDGKPMPSDSGHPEAIYALAEVLAERGEGVIQALVDTPGSRFGEVGLKAARISRRPVIHNVTLVNDYLPTYHEEMLAMLDAAEKDGLELYSMTLTTRGWNEFRAADWDIWNVIPEFREFTFAGDSVAKAAKARDEAFRARVRAAYTPEKLAPAGGPLETYVLINAYGVEPWASHEGKTVAEIASDLGRNDITDLFMDIVADTKAESDFMLPDAMSQDTAKVAQVLKHPRTIPGTSDGGAHVRFWAGGQYSTDLIMWMVRESGEMSLEEMHYKLSALPARVFNLDSRGTLEIGSAADVMIYDYDKLGYQRLRYEIAHDLPGGEWRRICKPEGIERVMVNGVTTFTNGTDCTGATPGMLLDSVGRDVREQLFAAE